MDKVYVNREGNKFSISKQELNKARKKGYGLGDIVSQITKQFGIKECDGCERRKEMLNRLGKKQI